MSIQPFHYIIWLLGSHFIVQQPKSCFFLTLVRLLGLPRSPAEAGLLRIATECPWGQGNPYGLPPAGASAQIPGGRLEQWLGALKS